MLQETGHCPSKSQCYFAHSAEELNVTLSDEFLAERINDSPASDAPAYNSDALFADVPKRSKPPKASDTSRCDNVHTWSDRRHADLNVQFQHD